MQITQYNLNLFFTLNEGPNPFKTNSEFMQYPLYNDQGYIAEGFKLDENYTEQTARIVFFKINSYKLSLSKPGFFKKTRNELAASLHMSLFNYTMPGIILADLGFFSSETEN